MYCEDYPCCGHTPADPCSTQAYDAVDYYDTARNPHAFCEHAEGWCDVEDDEPDEADDETSEPWEDEDGWLDGSYEE